MNHEERITYFGETDSRGKKIKFGIKSIDRARHTYVIGKTGMGKSILLENMAIQDIQNGEGLAFIDPHGSSAEKLLEYIPKERVQDVLYFAPFDMEYPVSFNIMENVDADKRHLVANGLMSVFEKIWEDMWSARMAYILNNTILALLEYPDATLLGINRVLVDKAYRKKVVDNVTDPSVKSFWVDEFAGYSDRYAADATPAIQNKIGQFTSNALMRNIIGQPESSFDIREMMDTKKILIVNMSKGRVGEGNASLLGSMLITKIYLAAMSRADASAKALVDLPQFYLYVDEFQSFANKSFADILSEARKYKLNLTIAHQYIEQMSEDVRAAVFGNVGTMITFRVGAIDAEIFEKEYDPTFTAEDLVSLGFRQMYLKLMIDGASSHPFSATSISQEDPKDASVKEDAVTFSRQHYGNPRTLVEENIKIWHEPINPQSSKKNNGDDPKKPPAIKTELPPLTPEQIKQTQLLKKKAPAVPKATKSAEQKIVFRPMQMKKNYSVPPIPREALKDAQQPAPQPLPQQNTVSLNDLKSKIIPAPKNKKEPSKENKLDLRNALASVMKDKSKDVQAPKEAEEKPAYKPFEKAHGKPFDTRPDVKVADVPKEPIKDIPKEAPKDTPQQKPKEVPESTLRNILKVDKETK
ncbi:type IV secretion system DNA-binding domain-containing protein [bacterium]|nr:type IV secretion system DNA-binding domain-containing protein [bacterium]MBT4894672.1 type IV secretion system DNA-binding domain-containing protein [bacterium]